MHIELPEFNECILCGRCLQVCPLFKAENREELSPRSKGLFLRDLIRDNNDFRKARKLAGLCLSCTRCQKTCPRNLDIPEMVSRIKASTPSWEKQVWEKTNRGFPLLLPYLSGLKNVGYFPDRARPYIKALARLRPEPFLQIIPDNALKNENMVLFPGCLGKYSWPWLETIAADILQKRGACLLPAPDWSCCGYSLYSAGAREKTRKYLKKNMALWAEIGSPKIITFCATCYRGLQLAAKLAVEEDTAAGSDFFASIVYLPDVMHDLRLAAEKKIPGRFFWHVPCHAPSSEKSLRASILSTGLKMNTGQDACCGLGGSMLLEDKKSCFSVARDFWAQAGISGSDIVVTECSGCVLQLESSKPDDKQIRHWLEFFGD